MAYQYKAAKVRSKGLDATWSDVNVSNMDILQMYQTYGKVYLVLTHAAYQHDLILDMDTVRTQITQDLRARTVQAWLTANGNTTLPTVNTMPPVNERHVRYADAWRAGYDIQPVDRRRAWNAQLPTGAKNDLLLRREDIDFREMWKYCMITVNGLFHRIGGSEDGLYVVDAGRSGREINNNHVGILSFREVGELDYIPIVPGMVYKTHGDQKYANYVNVRLPYNVENKTILLVLGGYLHVLDGTYRQTAPNSVLIDMNNYPLVERLFDARKALNLELLNLDSSETNPYHWSREDLQDDLTIEAYLTLPQSFIVVVDTPHMYMRTYDVEKTNLPGRFITNAEGFKRLPMFAGFNRLYDYMAMPEWGKMVLACDPAMDPNYNYATTQWQSEHSLDDTRYAGRLFEFSRARLVELGRFG